MQPWFGPRAWGAGGPSADKLCAAFWGGPDFPVSKFLALKQQWARAKPAHVAPCGPLPAAAALRPRQPDTGAADGKHRCGGGESLSIWVAAATGEGVGRGSGGCGATGRRCG